MRLVASNVYVGGDRGSALLDALLAAALVGMVIAGAIAGALASVRAAYRARDMQAAALAAQEKIEQLRALPAADLYQMSEPAAAPLTGTWPDSAGQVTYAVYVNRYDPAGGITTARTGLFQLEVAIRRGAAETAFYRATAYMRPWP